MKTEETIPISRSHVCDSS